MGPVDMEVKSAFAWARGQTRIVTFGVLSFKIDGHVAHITAEFSPRSVCRWHAELLHHITWKHWIETCCRLRFACASSLAFSPKKETSIRDSPALLLSLWVVFNARAQSADTSREADVSRRCDYRQ